MDTKNVLEIALLSSSEQPPLFTCKAHIFQVDPDTRKTWIPLSSGAGMFAFRIYLAMTIDIVSF